MPIIVHCKKAKSGTFVYVGRPSKWGNPFSHKSGTLAQYKMDTIEEAVIAYEIWLDTQPELLNSLSELSGKDLGCWCVHKGDELCHARVLLARANHVSIQIKGQIIT